MDNNLKNIEPKIVFKYFQEISRIPRCSGNEKEISDYLVDFAKMHNLEALQDEALNVIIKKKGTTGFENAPTVILQGHMDMVCEKNKDTIHDFSKDPICLKIDGDMTRAESTTLGADNGIAVAFCQAILSSDDIPHPPLEVLITTEEEVGLRGASKVKASNLKGKILINIDSEEEGVLLASCSGGIRSEVSVPIVWERNVKSLTSYYLKIGGLKGGHSGMEIDKGRGNSNKLMGRVLSDLVSNFKIGVAEINGGAKMNAIPREGEALILIKEAHKKGIREKISSWNEIFKNELKSSDPDIFLQLEKSNKKVDKVFSMDTLNKIISLYLLIPCGVQTMSMDISGLVESSTNLGVVTTTENKVVFSSATRSSVRSLKDYIVKQIEKIAEAVGAEIITKSSYPEWEYKPNSYIRELFISTYEKLYGKKPEVTAVHGGLECGTFNGILGDIDMISFGPNIYDVHTPNEHLSISSTKRTWEYLLTVLKEIK